MSGDMHHGGGTGSGGISNPGFDPLGAGEFGSSNNSHSSGEKWKKFADKQYNEYFQSCPGAHGDYTTPLTSQGQDHPKNVCCLKCGKEGYLERMIGNVEFSCTKCQIVCPWYLWPDQCQCLISVVP